MSKSDWLIGVVDRQGFLKAEAGEILLTRIGKAAAQPPESGAVRLAEEDLGKVVLARGALEGRVLYGAEVVETVPAWTSTLLQRLTAEGVVSFDAMARRAAAIEADRREAEGPTKLCALVIGHKKASPGAVNEPAGLSEFVFNEDLALQIERRMTRAKVQRVYRRTWNELPADINGLGPDFIVSLHCNAYDRRASGTEVLYYHKSTGGKRMAEIFQRRLVDCLGLPDRGVKPKTSEDRGGNLLKNTRAPCIIVEPFFIDNDGDLARARERLDDLVAAYASAIDAVAAEG